MDGERVEVHKHAKKRMRPLSSHLNQTRLVNKGFRKWKKKTSSLVNANVCCDCSLLSVKDPSASIKPQRANVVKIIHV